MHEIIVKLPYITRNAAENLSTAKEDKKRVLFV